MPENKKSLMKASMIFTQLFKSLGENSYEELKKTPHK